MTSAPCERKRCSPFDIVLYNGAPEDGEALRMLVTVCGLDGGQPAQPARFVALPTARVWLARRAERVLGFAATFESLTAAGRRLEVDLLGVHPDERGQGTGTALVRRAIEGWAGAARALIRIGNVASERAFASAGFAPEAVVRELLVLVPAGKSLELTAEAQRPQRRPVRSRRPHRSGPLRSLRLCGGQGRCNEQPAGFFELLPVTTLTYRGAWVEALEAEGDRLRAWRALAAGAAAWAAERRLDMLGALPALAQRRCRRALAEAGYATEGHYRFFLRRGRDGTC